MIGHRNGFLSIAVITFLLFGCDSGSSGGSGSDIAQPDIQLNLERTAVSEAAGQVNGSIALERVSGEDLAFTLSLSPESETVILPDGVVLIPAGQNLAGFQLQLIDNDDIGGLQTFTLTATAQNNPLTRDSIMLEVLDDDDVPRLQAQSAHWDPTGRFIAAADCGSCHRASQPGDQPAVLRAPESPNDAVPSPEGEDISPITDWKSSVMANAFTDPYFRAAMAHEAEHFPELAGFIEDKCLTCHTPMARLHAHKTGVGLEDGFFRAATAMIAPHAREGISCALCHQITDDVITQDINSGAYDVDYHREPPLIFGPYQAPVKQAMVNAIGFEPEFGMQMSDARHCASCHELFTPVIDNATDQPTGGYFPEQTPYTEWTLSDFGPQGSTTTTCQDCHMASDAIGDNFLTRLAVNRNDGSVNKNWPERAPYSPHVFLGGNTWLLETLEMFREELGRDSINQAGEFQQTAERTREFLKTAASLSSSGVSADSNLLSYQVTINNHTGHKLPTSFPSRRMWLATRVTDARGVTVFESGVPDDRYYLPADAAFTRAECLASRKPAGFDSTSCFSPHVDLVTSAEQVPVYETILKSTTDQITHILLYASASFKDNRIPPKGFITENAPDFVKPDGVEGDTNFNAGGSGSDTVSYQLSLPDGAQRPLQVETTLYYQTIRPTFVHAIRGKHEAISQFRTAAELNPPPAEVLSSLSFTVN